MAEHWSQNTALLKGLIVGMTGLLVVGLVLLVVGMARTAGELASPPAGEGRIALPQGARVLEMAPDGERLYLRIEEPGGGQAILLLDEAKKPIGRWTLEPAR